VARLNASVDASPKPAASAGLLPQLTDLLATPGPFRELLDHQAIAPRLDEILGAGHRLDMEPVGIVMETGDAGGPLHGGGSDRASFAQSAFWHAGRFYTGMVVVEFFLTPQGPGDGGLGIISGSHKAELPLPASMNGGVFPGVSAIAPGSPEWRAAAAAGAAHKAVTEIHAAAGDAVIFAEACAHITLPWRAAHQRRVLLYRFCPGFQATQYPRGVEPLPPPAWVLTMSPAQQAVLAPPGQGFGVNRGGNQGDRPRHQGRVLVPPESPAPPPTDAGGAPPPLLGKEQSYLFDLNGFLHLKAALSAAEVARLNAALDRRAEPGEPAVGMLEGGPDTEAFRELLVHPATVPALNTILGAGYRLDSGPNLGSEEQTEFHGGAVERSFGGNFEGYFWRGGRMFSGRVVVEFVLRDEDASAGGLVVVPGSHKSNIEAPFTFERGLSHPPGRNEPVMAWDGAAGIAELRDKFQNSMVEVNAAAGEYHICLSSD
jgi:hypothetical protein